MAGQLIAQRDNLIYTRKLSREIDAAYETFKAREPGGDAGLYQAFRAQARNVLRHRFKADQLDPSLEYEIANRAMMGLSSFKGASKLATWFFTIAKREADRALAAMITRRTEMESISPSDDGEPQPPPELVDKRSPLPALEAKWDVDALRRGIPPEQFDVIELMAEGHSLVQIAQKLDIPIGTIRSRYRLAKQKMRQKASK